MEVYFASEKLAELIENDRKRVRAFGAENAKWIQKRLDNLRFASTLEVLRALPGRTHELSGDRAGTFAIDLKHGYRLILKPAEDAPPRKPDGGLNWQAITSVIVIAVEDYHD